VGGGVVGPFQVMGVPALSLGNKALHEGLQVGAGGGIPVFTEDQRGAGVRQEKIAHAFLHVPIAQLGSYEFGDIMQSLAVG